MTRTLIAALWSADDRSGLQSIFREPEALGRAIAQGRGRDRAGASTTLLRKPGVHRDVQSGKKATEDHPMTLAAINCAICGKPCKLAPTTPQAPGPNWYCARCDAFTETDVEVED